MNLLSIVVNYHTYDHLQNFINSYNKYVDCKGRELHVVDIQPTALITQGPFGFTSHDENVGYARAVNDAAALYSDLESYPHDVIGIFNADTRFVDVDCVDSCLQLLLMIQGLVLLGLNNIIQKIKLHMLEFLEQIASPLIEVGCLDI
jgi:GT2 family glycosyltransferase